MDFGSLVGSRVEYRGETPRTRLQGTIVAVWIAKDKEDSVRVAIANSTDGRVFERALKGCWLLDYIEKDDGFKKDDTAQ